MKILADMGVSMTTVKALRDNGFDITHLLEERLERLTDSKIIEKAKIEGRVIVTFDLDFGDLLALGKDSLPSVILIRLANETPISVTPKVLSVLLNHKDDLSSGSIITLTENRIRVRKLTIF